MNTPERLVLFDLDGTLIDDAYQVTDDGIYDAIQRAQAAGWKVGLNSDTPYEALCIWRDRFGMNGPIVAEKGAVVELDGRPDFDAATAARVAEARERIAGCALEQGLVLWSGNPVEALRNGIWFRQPGETVLLLNTLSLCSLRFFVRVVGADGELRLDDARARAIVDDCRPLFPAFDAIDEDYNPAFGLLIAVRSGTNKRAGVQRLLQSAGIARCVMVGNSMSDYIGGDIAEQLAVGNATPEYQAVATTVPQQITSGCVAVLNQLIDRTTETNETSKPEGAEA